MTDAEWMEQFEKGTLPNSSFHHADHVRMAFLYLRHYPVLEAFSRFTSSLKQFAAKNGKPNIYNETITWGYLLLIRERMARADARQTWAEFSGDNEDLSLHDNDILKKFYRPETLKSDLARRVFLFPDKQ